MSVGAKDGLKNLIAGQPLLHVLDTNHLRWIGLLLVLRPSVPMHDSLSCLLLPNLESMPLLHSLCHIADLGQTFETLLQVFTLEESEREGEARSLNELIDFLSRYLADL